MTSALACFTDHCRARFPITDVIYNCPRCGGLLEAVYGPSEHSPEALKTLWRERRLSNGPLDQSGVWRYRELIPFLPADSPVVTLREGCTPLLDAPRAARYGGSRSPHLQTPGIQPHRLVQRQRHDLRGGPGAPPRPAPRGLRLHRQHLRFHGRLRQRRRIAARHLPPARQHRPREAGAGARIRRPHPAGGGQLRPDPGPGAPHRRAPRHLPAELHQSLPHRRAEDHHGRDDGPARLARARLGGASGRQPRQYLRLRQGPPRNAAARSDRPTAAPGRDSGRGFRPLLRPLATARTALTCRESSIPRLSRPPSRSATRCHGRKRFTK